MQSIDSRLETLEHKSQQQANPIDVCEYLATLPFWCNNNTLHIDDPDYKHTAKCCTTHIIGLPRHPATNEEMTLTPFQVDFANKVISGRDEFGDDMAKLRKPLLMHINKGRQMGFTEIVLRLILHFSFSRYAASNIGIIAGTHVNLSSKDLRRLAILYKSIPIVVEQWIKNNTLRLVNGTVIEAFPASEEAMTGDTKYKCIFMDEAAKWKLVDDQPVFNSIMPIVRSNGADLYLVSTPKGPTKMFYEIHEKPEDFVMFEYDIWHSEGNLYTKEEIEEKIATSTEDPFQEYLCKYTIGKGSIFGLVTDLDRHGKTEWLVEYDEEKDKDGIMWHES